MPTVINKNVDVVAAEDRIDLYLELSEKECEEFEAAYGEFMQTTLDHIVDNKDGVTALEVYKKAKDTFKGKQLEMFISQVTNQLFITILDLMERDANPFSRLIRALDEDSPSVAVDINVDNVADKGRD